MILTRDRSVGSTIIRLTGPLILGETLLYLWLIVPCRAIQSREDLAPQPQSNTSSLDV